MVKIENWREWMVFNSVSFGQMAEWFLAQPLYGQILIVIGIITVITLIGVAIYYLLKGIAYLIYYILKGLFYLLKGICIGFYKLFKALYHAISGKPIKDAKKQTPVMPTEQVPVPAQPVQRVVKEIRPEVAYCSECGVRFTDNMTQQLEDNGIVFCVHCGNCFKTQSAKIEG